MPRRSPLPAGAPLLAVAAMALAAGCSSAAPASGQAGAATARTAGRPCGNGRTAAGVQVVIMVQRSQVSCPVARAVEQSYASAIASGKVPGNGGGAPVTVRGWVCQGFNTPEVLRTGNASKCTRGSQEILAVLPSPAGSS